jgi:hypothetical protein
MNRIMKGTLLTVALLGFATVAGAASAAPFSRVDYSAECAKLQAEWTGADRDAPWNVDGRFAQARQDAENGAAFCKSDFPAMHQKGVAEYEAAFQLIGVTPTF